MSTRFGGLPSFRGLRRAPFPRGERHDRSDGGQKSWGKVAWSASVGCVLQSPCSEALRRIEELPVAAPASTRRARAPASDGRVEGGLFTVCSDCRVVRMWVRFRAGAQGLWRIDRHPIRPVLKHGPRSLTCARVIGLYETHRRNESEGRSRSVRGRILPSRGEAHCRPVSIATSMRRSKSVHVGTRKMVNYA